MIITHLLTYLNWFNPLCWVLKSKLEDEAENCCDTAVIESGKSTTDYAENLISIAKQSRKESVLLAQMLVNKSKFHKRVKLILEGNMNLLNYKSIRYFISILISAGVLLGAGTQVFSADAVREELYAISTPIAVYPNASCR